MVQWDEMHPYNAVHVAELRGPLEAMRLCDCINAIVGRRGLARLTLDRERSAFQYEGGPVACEIRTLSGEPATSSTTEAEIERQLNLRFDLTGPFCPFRFFVVPAGDAFHLGLVYYHAVADAESVFSVLEEIASAYGGGGEAVASAPPELYPDRRAHLLRRHPLTVVRKVLAVPAHTRQLRRSCRPRYADAGDLTNGVVRLPLAPEEFHALRAAAKSWGVTVNDLLLALLLKGLAPKAAGRFDARRRRRLSVGCIVNLRQDLPADQRGAFGLFLGSFTVTHAVPEGIGLRRLAGDIRGQTAPIKRHKLYLATPIALAFARLMLRLFGPARRNGFYAKHHPLWGGLTNLNLNRLWNPPPSHALRDYWRSVSTGPVTPLVLSATTIGDRMNLTVSYRTTVFSRTDVADLAGHFREGLEETQREL